MSDIAPLVLTITTAGLAAFTAAQGADDIDLTIAQVGVTGQPFVVAPTLTALPGEVKRLDTVSGEVLDGAIVHLVARDASTDVYAVTGFGLFLTDGTLFAVYGGNTVILQKSSQSFTNLALDLRFPTVDAGQITFGDANFLDPPASETVKGVAYIATQAVVDAGADDSMIVTAKKLAARLSAFLTASFASSAETIAGTISTKAVHPAGLKAALDDRLGAGSPTAFIKTLLAVASATTARATLGFGNVATLNTGAGNGIDADKLDGLEGAAYLRIIDSGSNANGSWRKFSDGSIEQWGRTAIVANGTPIVSSTQNLPTPFASEFDCVVGNFASTGGDANFDASLNFPSTALDSFGFFASAHGNNGANLPSVDFFWRAWGK